MIRLQALRKDIKRVLTSGASTPPNTPAPGDVHLVGDLASGAWNGHDYTIAVFAGGRWSFQKPEEGDSVWVETGIQCTFHAGTWRKTFDVASAGVEAHTLAHQHGGADELGTATPTPNAIPKADASGKLAAGWVVASAATTGVVQDILTYTDTANKIIGPLSDTPIAAGNTGMTVMGGPDQQYTQDYTVREVIGGSAPGYYICIDPGSTAPGGGAFTPGSNPGTGISSILGVSDRVKTTYSAV